MNTTFEIYPSSGPILALIYLALFIFGWFYDSLIALAERKGYLEGHTAYSVALGVTVTLMPFIFVETVQIWWVYMAFVASGTPMIAGSWWRHVQARRREQEALRQA